MINEHACYALPQEMALFFREHLEYLREHSVDPDKRCYIDTLESPRHYIDLENLPEVDSLPATITWSQARNTWGEYHLRQTGIIPWQIYLSYLQLKKAFQEGDLKRSLKIAAELGHYIGDSHVPLHTTKNYNGQLTNQRGIHALWETRIPEKYVIDYDLLVGRGRYIKNPLEEAWKIVRESHILVDSVLLREKLSSKQIPQDQKYAYVSRKGKLSKNYSDAFVKHYHNSLDGMVEARMKASILMVSSYWYTAWVDAGKPDLSKSKLDLYPTDTLKSPIPEQKIKGRAEWH